MHVRGMGNNIFSSYYEKMRSVKLFKLVTIELEEQGPEVQKKRNTNIWNFGFALKFSKIFFFQKMRACAVRGDFFLVTTKMWRNKICLCRSESDLKNKSPKYEKN